MTRPTVYGYDGMVAAPHYLAVLAGAEVLRDGGSAVDAAIAANVTMSVVWPHMCGAGGDLFAQVWSGGLFGLNASGRAGARMTPDAYRDRGQQTMPPRGPLSITVPGAVDGWFTLHARWGRLDMPRLFRDAVQYARHGFAISPILSRAIRGNTELLERVGGAANVFVRNGSAAGDRLVQADLADSLESIARQGPGVMYQGSLAERITAYLGQVGSLLTADDFAAHRSEWVEPLSTDYRGVTVFELPPNTQGVTLLEWLNMLGPLDLASLAPSELIHQSLERKKLAFADRDHYIADPVFASVPIDRLLDASYARELGDRVTSRAADQRVVAAAGDGAGDTVYLCAADREGMMVSLIQSLYSAWGSGVLVPGTGVTLHNRGYGFRLADGHPNALAPGKRPFHTLIPGFALRDGQPWLAFGTRGADGQPQTGVQILSNLLDFGLEPQAAVEAPRWVHGAPGGKYPRTALVLEARYPASVAVDLASRGHEVLVGEALDLAMGTVQLIQRDNLRGCYLGASDPRGDGCALAV
jgi:gamma-glutamyltranspeptidase/glutathione hydrolase